MTALSDAKIYGGIGAILVILTGIPAYGWILGIVGFILVLIAINRISVEVGDRQIFTNAILSIVFAIVAVAVAAIFVIALLYHFVGFNNLPSYNYTQFQNMAQASAGDIFLVIIPALLATWVLLIFSAYFLRRVYGSISAKLNVPMFETGALLYLIGALTAVIVVGFLILFVAEIIIAIAFFSIPDNVPGKQPLPGQ